MALQTSGPISLDDIHVEAGGTTATQAGINDTDILNLIGKSSATQMGFNEWYGASAGPTLKYTMAATQIAPTTTGKNASAAFVSFKSPTAITASQDFVTDPRAEGFICRDFQHQRNNVGQGYRECVAVLQQGYNGVLGVVSNQNGTYAFRRPSPADNYFIVKYNGVAVMGPTDELYNGPYSPPAYRPYVANDTSLLTTGANASANINIVNNRQTLSLWSLEYYSI